MTSKINYISAIPGVGKTKFSVAQLVKCVREKSHYAMYVAPTVELLQEVESYMKADLTPKEMEQVRIFHSKDDKIGTVSKSVQMAMKGGIDQHGRVFKEPKLGMVILITHATFMNLKSLPASDLTDLYFDEARKCVSQSHSIKLTSKRQKAVVMSMLNLERYEGTKYFKVTSDVSKKDYQARMASVTWEPKQRRAIEALVRAAHNRRFDTYVSGIKDKSLKIFEVTMPSKIFDGYRKVTLMSAFFEDSQMYHLLKLMGTPLVDVTRSALPDYQKRHQELTNRYSKVSVVPLLNQEKVLSKSHLSGFLISSERDDLLANLQALGFEGKGRLRILKEYALDSRAYKLTGKDKKALSLLEANKDDFEFVPLKWMLAQSKKIIGSWTRKVADKESIKAPLLIVNKKYERDAERYAPDYKVISTQVHGLNKYYKHEVVVFLAAINPTPDLCRFYSTYLPNYNVEKDHVADVCIQCVCRGSVRDTGTSKPTLVIVSDRGMMKHVHDKMFSMPTLRADKMPSQFMISSNLSETKTLRVKGVSKTKSTKDRQTDWVNKGNNKEIRALRVAVSKLRKKLREGTGKDTPAKLKAAEAKLEAVLNDTYISEGGNKLDFRGEDISLPKGCITVSM